MKLKEIISLLLASPNIASQAPIYEKYDKNVQGNTVWERGQVAASICTPFRDFGELPDDKSKIGVVIGTGGNPNYAKINAGLAAKHALIEALIKISAVGGLPLSATDCLNFGNPEKKEQMGAFVSAVKGLSEVCKKLQIPIVSGNVSLYNESNGKSVPPSALISLFGRVDDPTIVPQVGFQKSGATIYLIGKRTEQLGGSEFLKVCDKNDTRIPEVNFEEIQVLSDILRTLAISRSIDTANPILRGGAIITILKSCFVSSLGAKITIDDSVDVPSFCFNESPGAIVATDQPKAVENLCGDLAIKIGQTSEDQRLILNIGEKMMFDEGLSEWKGVWKNGLRKIV